MTTRPRGKYYEGGMCTGYGNLEKGHQSEAGLGVQ